MTGPPAARQIVERAIAERTFPAATLDVGSSAGSLWNDALGALTFDAGAPRASLDTPFDLASLTKVIATTTIQMDLVGAGRVRLDDPVSEFFGEWRGADRENVTVRDLLEHASGLAARLVDPPPKSRREFEHDICQMPLEYRPRTQSIYSDLDFILLGFLAADRGGASLAELFDQITVRLKPDTTYEITASEITAGEITADAIRTDDITADDATADAIRTDDITADEIDERAGETTAVVSGFSRTVDRPLTFDLSPDLRKLAAPTAPLADDPRRGRLLAGEVHDHYAAALGGAAGHAGLFGTASAVAAFARTILRAARGDGSLPPPFSPERVAEFTAKSAVPSSSRALGWDTMLPTSSCGSAMSAKAFGHVGFTGTSLWIDPERDRYYVLLTNRACRGGSLEAMRSVRRAFHDALAAF